MIEKILKAVGKDQISSDEARALLKPTGLLDITEFGRSVACGDGSSASMRQNRPKSSRRHFIHDHFPLSQLLPPHHSGRHLARCIH